MNAKRTHIFFHPFLLCVLLLGVFSVCDAQAQLNGDLLKFELITPEDGLSGQHIGGIVQDRLGFLWFGTENGLDKYDGYTFTRYRFDPDEQEQFGVRKRGERMKNQKVSPMSRLSL